jgi:exopolysaccharide biosynthesis predicted pyruvyltransferase EpsI
VEMEEFHPRRKNGIMDREFQYLAETIHATCGRGVVYYYCDEGNWGDALIRQGTKKFFRDIGQQYFEINIHEGPVFRLVNYYLPLLVKGTLILGGGGGWSNAWNKAIRVMKNIASSYRKAIVLPSTFEIRVDFPGTIFFSRDKFESMQRYPEATFCHDMAFYLGMQTGEKGNGTGYFYRTDREASGSITIPPDNDDISLKGTHLSPITPFFDAISRYRIIHTDRLHVAIAACLLGKELHFYPGAYFKNKAVFRSSIEGRYENVHFHDNQSIGS